MSEFDRAHSIGGPSMWVGQPIFNNQLGPQEHNESIRELIKTIMDLQERLPEEGGDLPDVKPLPSPDRSDNPKGGKEIGTKEIGRALEGLDKLFTVIFTKASDIIQKSPLFHSSQENHRKIKEEKNENPESKTPGLAIQQKVATPLPAQSIGNVPEEIVIPEMAHYAKNMDTPTVKVQLHTLKELSQLINFKEQLEAQKKKIMEASEAKEISLPLDRGLVKPVLNQADYQSVVEILQNILVKPSAEPPKTGAQVQQNEKDFPASQPEKAKNVEKERPDQKNQEVRAERRQNAEIVQPKSDVFIVAKSAAHVPINENSAQPAMNPIANSPEKTAVQHGKPRVDMILPLGRSDRSDSESIGTRRHAEDGVVTLPFFFSLKVPPEEARRRRNARDSKESKQRDDDGFSLSDIIAMLLCAVICGERTPEGIFKYVDARAEVFCGSKRVPSLNTIKWILHRMNSVTFGKCLFQSISQERRDECIHKVNVWESDRGLILGMLKSMAADEDALSGILKIFDLSQAAIAIDAPFLKPSLARQIRMQGAHYSFVIRDSLGDIYNKAAELFEFQARNSPVGFDRFKENFITEEREILISNHTEWMEGQQDWIGLRTFGRLKSTTFSTNNILSETRIYLSSLPMQAEAFSSKVRILTALENKTHWLADIIFDPGKIEHMSSNLAQLVELSLELLHRESSLKASLETKRRKARTDNQYLFTVLTS